MSPTRSWRARLSATRPRMIRSAWLCWWLLTSVCLSPAAQVGVHRDGGGHALVPPPVEAATDLPQPLGPVPEDELPGFVKEEVHMGVRFRISLYSPNSAVAEQAFAAAFAEIARLEQVFSDYRDSSEARTLDHGPLETPLPLSPDMQTLLQCCVELHQQTDGYFDVTLGALTKPWRAARRAQHPPNAAELALAKTRVGMELLQLTDNAQLLKRTPGFELDFGGIAKGYAADQVLRLLAERFRITRVLVDASGDLVAGDPPPGKLGWLVGLARPANEPGPLTRILLANQALAGSGDANQFLLADQTRWSHLLDPLKREPILGQNLTLVLAPDGTTADALASALSVCPAENFPLILERFPRVAAKRYRQLADATDLEVLESAGWQGFLLASEAATASDAGQR